MKHSRILALLMAAVMTMTMFPMGVLAAETEGTENNPAETEIEESAAIEEIETEESIAEEAVAETEEETAGAEKRELVPETVIESDPLEWSDSDVSKSEVKSSNESTSQIIYHTTIEEAAEELRKQMTKREETIQIGYQTSDSDYSSYLEDIFNEAMEHTGGSTEGDYFLWNYGGMSASTSVSKQDGSYYLTFTYEITYYTNAQQEALMNEAVDSLMNQLALDGKTEYEKVSSIYDYMTTNISYDYANLYDEDYLLKYTAYAALINKTAVCQGFATLFYRLALEAGLSARVISGTMKGESHAWNIVQIDGLYYYIDASSGSPVVNKEDYFLKGSISFSDFKPASEYLTNDFVTRYPISSFDYSVDEISGTVVSTGNLTSDIQWSVLCSTGDDGKQVYYLEIDGTGAMPDYTSNTIVPWQEWRNNIELIKVKSGITSVGSYMFSDMESLSVVQLPSTVTSIGTKAFFNCPSLSNLQIPSSVTSFGEKAIGGKYGDVDWEYIPNLKKLIISGMGKMGEPYKDESTLERNAEYVPWRMFCQAIEEVTVESGVTNLSTYAFHSFSNLTKITLPSTLNEIGEGAIESCTSLTSICIPDSVTTIGHYAFRYCSELRSIHIPSSVTSVGVRAFSDCSRLFSFYFYGDAPSFESQAIMNNNFITIHYSAKSSGWSTVKKTFSKITFEEWTPGNYDTSGSNFEGDTIKGETSGTYGSNIEWEFDEKTSKLIISGHGDMREPITITSVDSEGYTHTQYSTDAVEWAPFRKNITSVEMSGDITSITMFAFYWLTGAKDITIPDTVKIIGDEAFKYCAKLQELTLSDKLTSIGKGAFENCSSLESIYISNNLNTVSKDAFLGCSKLTDVYFGGNETEWKSIIIDEGNECLNNAKIHYGCTGIEHFEETIEFENYYYTCPYGDSITVTATYRSLTAPKSVSWTCDDEAAVQFSGSSTQGPSVTGEKNTYWVSVEIKGLKQGEHEIILAVDENSANITIDITGFTIAWDNSDDYSFYVGDDAVLSGTIIKESDHIDIETEFQNITWSVSDSAIVAIKNVTLEKDNAEGSIYHWSIRIRALEVGSVVLTGASSNGIKLSRKIVSNESFFVLSPKMNEQNVDHSIQPNIIFRTGMRLSGHGYIRLYDANNDEEPIESIIADETQGVVIIEPSEEKDPSSKLNITLKKRLKPGKEYYITIDPEAILCLEWDEEKREYVENGEYFPGIGKEEWRFKTIALDYMHFNNPKDEIPEELYYYLFRPLKAKYYVELGRPDKDRGKEGQCYGWAYTIGAKKSGYIGINNYDDCLACLERNSINKVNNKTLLNYIQLSFLYQFAAKNIRESRDSRDQYEKIYQALKNQFDRGENIVINIEENDKAHTLFPIDIINETDNEIQIRVLDCNSPEGTFYGTLILKKQFGEIVGFSYRNYNDHIDYNTIDNTLDAAFLSQKVEEDTTNLIFSTNAIDADGLHKVIVKGSESKGDDSFLYWTENESYSCMFANSTIVGMTDGFSSAEVSIQQDTPVQVDLNAEGVSVDPIDTNQVSYSVRFEQAEDNGNNIEYLEISSMTSKGITATQTEKGIEISTNESEEYQVRNDKYVISFVNEGNSVLIKNNGTIKVYEDENGEGEFDKEINVEVISSPIIDCSGICGDNVTWTLDDDGTLTISGTGDMYDYEPWSGNISPWHEYRENITSVVISNGVTRIGQHAFYEFTNLESISIPDGVKSIGRGAFHECETITSIVIPESVTDIEDQTFGYCKNLTHINIPKGITSIEYGLFLSCHSLQSITIPDGVTKIGNCAFEYCTSLSEVSIPESVQSIGSNAFEKCKISSISIPSQVTSLESRVFKDCTQLTEITIPASIQSIGETAFWGCPVLAKVVFEGDAPSIDQKAFLEVSAEAFYPAGNSSWTTDVMQNYGGNLSWVPYGEDYSISACSVSLSSDHYVYDGKEKKPTVTVKKGSMVLGNGTDYTVSYSDNVDAGTAVVTITGQGNYTGTLEKSFTIAKASQVVTAELDSNEVPVEFMIHVKVSGIGTIKYESSNPEIAKVDAGGWITGVSKGEAIITITAQGDKNHLSASTAVTVTVVDVYELDSGSCGEDAIWTYYNDGTVKVIGTGMMTLVQRSNGAYNWDYCDNTPFGEKIHTVIVCDGITAIDDDVFAVRGSNGVGKMSASPQNIIIADTVESIGGRAFYRCEALEYVTFGSGLSSLGDYSFAYCSSLKSIEIPEDNQYFKAIDGVLYSKDSSILFKVPAADRTEYEIPEGTVTLKEDSFGDIVSLQSVTIPKSVKNINFEAFDGCENLQEVYYAGSKTDWGKISIGESNDELLSANIHFAIPEETQKIGRAELEKSEYVYTGHEIKPVLKVYSESSDLLAEGADYTISYKNNTNAGTATVVVIGIGNYTGTIEKTFTILKANQTLEVSVDSSSIVVGDTATITVKGKGAITYSSRNTNIAVVNEQGIITGKAAGTTIITVKAAGDGNYNQATKTIQITVSEPVHITDISNCEIIVANVVYTGEALIPAVMIRNGGVTLKEDTDYTLSYKNNINVGKGTVTITGIGNYTGTIEKTFTILKADQTLEVSVESPSIAVGGTAAITANGRGAITYSSDNTSVADVNEQGIITGKAAGTATITVTAAGDQNYKEASKTIQISVILLSTPVLSKVESVYGGVRVTWAAVTGAENYRVYRKTGTGSWTRIGDTTEPVYLDTTAKSGTKYTYTVRCLNKDATAFTSSFDRTGKAIIFIASPILGKTENVSGGVKINWGKVTGAVKYRVFRKTADSGWKKLADTTALTYTDKTAVSGTEYTYTVRCVNKAGTGFTSGFDANGITIRYIATPTLSKVESVYGGVRVTWAAVNGAENYRVYRKTGSGSWTRIGDTTEPVYLDTTAKSGTKYAYTVRCLNKDATAFTSSFDRTGKAIVFIASPVLGKAESVNGGVQISWGKVTGAVKYRVFRKTAGTGWKKLADTTTVSYTDKTAMSGTEYTYTVRCINWGGTGYTSGFDANGLTITYLQTPVLLRAENIYGGVKVTWAAVPGAENYRVYRKTGTGSWTRIGDTAKTVYTDAAVVSGTKYTYTVRCLNKDATAFTSSFNRTGKAVTYIAAPVLNDPQIVSGGIKISWGKVPGAVNYRVFRKTADSNWIRLANTTALSYTDKTAVKGTEYRYTVRCISSDGKVYTSNYDVLGKTVVSGSAYARDQYTKVIFDDTYGEQRIFCYHIPEIILLNGTKAAANDQIRLDMMAVLEEGVFSYEGQGEPSIATMLYQWGISGDTLSVVIQTSRQYYWFDYYVYNISLTTGELVSSKTLLTQNGYTEDSFYTAAGEVMTRYMDEYVRNFGMGEEYFNEIRTKTLTRSNIRASVPFIKPDGSIGFVANIYSAAGADHYYHLMNLEGEMESDRLECGIDHTEGY